MPDEIKPGDAVYYDQPRFFGANKSFTRHRLTVQGLHEYENSLTASKGGGKRSTFILRRSEVRLKSIVDAEEKAARIEDMMKHEKQQLDPIVKSWSEGNLTGSDIARDLKMSVFKVRKLLKLAVERGLIVKESSLQKDKQSSPSPQQ